MGHDEELTSDQIDPNISTLHGAIKRTWCSFCGISSIHGLKYIRDEDTNNIVRFIWLLISLVMFLCAIVMVQTFYIDYRSNPTRMNVDSDHIPVTDLYFPAITICPEVLFNMEKSETFLKTLTFRNGTTMNDVLNRLRIFYGFMLDDEKYSAEDIELMESILEYNNLTFVEFVDHLRWDCNDILHRCRYQGRIETCDSLFQISKTFFGHCCSFNLKQPGLNYTARGAIGGLENGLSLSLRYNDDKYDTIMSYSHGFKLLVGDADAFPSAHAISKFISLDHEVFQALLVEETIASDAVKGLPIDARKCLSTDEFNLRYFPAYVYPNCELNCRVLNMMKYCGCHTYFFDFNRTNDRICTFRDIPCLVDHFSEIITRQHKTQCDCPSTCEYFNFHVQASRLPIELDIPTVDTFYDDVRKGDAIVHIFLNSQVYRRYRHDLLTSMVLLVSNLGSAFSLFVGMSMLSVVEIFYYFTVILHKNYRLEQRARDKYQLFIHSKHDRK